MTYIMTKNGWRRLAVICFNQVWELQSWDANGKEWVADRLNGRLRLVRTEEVLSGGESDV